MTEAEVWELVVQNEGLLRSLVRKRLPRYRWGELDDLYSEVVLLRAHSIMRLYDPGHQSGALPITYLARNVEWYAMERIVDRKYRKRIVADSLDCVMGGGGGGGGGKEGERGVEPASSSGDGQVCIEADSLLSALAGRSDLAADVLRWRYVRGNDVREIARHLNLRHAEVEDLLEWARGLARDVTDGVVRVSDQWASYGREK